jgi:hypothetical protein
MPAKACRGFAYKQNGWAVAFGKRRAKSLSSVILCDGQSTDQGGARRRIIIASCT